MRSGTSRRFWKRPPAAWPVTRMPASTASPRLPASAGFTLYGHFESRSALIAEVAARAVRQTDAALEGVDLDGDPRAALVRRLTATWELTHRFGALVVAAENALPADELREAHRKARRARQATAASRSPRGRFRADMPLAWQVTTIQGVVHAASAAAHRGEITVAKAPLLVCATVVAALTPPGTPVPTSVSQRSRANVMGMTDVVICEPIRTPVGRFGGALSSLSASDLAAQTLTELVRRTGLREGDVRRRARTVLSEREAPAIGQTAALDAAPWIAPRLGAQSEQAKTSAYAPRLPRSVHLPPPSQGFRRCVSRRCHGTLARCRPGAATRMVPGRGRRGADGMRCRARAGQRRGHTARAASL